MSEGELGRGPPDAGTSGPCFARRATALKDHRFRSHVASARRTVAEVAQDGQRVRMVSAAGASYKSCVADVLTMTGGQVRCISSRCWLRWHVIQSRKRVAECGRQDVGGAQVPHQECDLSCHFSMDLQAR